MTDVLTTAELAEIRARVECCGHEWFFFESADRLLSHVAAEKQNLEAGTRELRRYVEGNGFTWCEDESTVFNVTTAIGWLGGALETANKQLAAVEAERDRLREIVEAADAFIKARVAERESAYVDGFSAMEREITEDRLFAALSETPTNG